MNAAGSASAQDRLREAQEHLGNGRHAEAEQSLRQAIALLTGQPGAGEQDLACALNDLADLRCAQGHYDVESEALYRRAAEVFERTAGPEHPDVELRGDAPTAEALYRESLVLREKLLGAEHPQVATSLNNLAVLYRSLGCLDEAEACFRKALPILAATRGPEHPNTRDCRASYAALLRELGREEEAGAVVTRS